MTSSPRHYGKKQLGNSVAHGRIKRKWEMRSPGLWVRLF